MKQILLANAKKESKIESKSLTRIISTLYHTGEQATTSKEEEGSVGRTDER